MQTYILSIGNEILRGDIVDTNAQWLAQQLQQLGFEVVEQIAVGDAPALLKSTMCRLSKKEALIVVTGGLGPTDDDITRETLCSVAGVAARLNRRAWRDIQERFRSYNRPVGQSNRRQAMLPIGCSPFYNSCGTAPGLGLKVERAHFALMPGVPAEMKAMYSDQLQPWLQKKFKLSGAPFIKKFKLHGIGESAAAEALGDLLARDRDPRVDITVSDHVITLTVVAQRRGDYKKELRAIYKTIRHQLGEYIYSEKDIGLAEALVTTLQKREMKMAAVESCTGGMVAADLMSVSGASRVFEEGAITYSNEAKQRTVGVKAATLTKHGAVSEETAAEMASGMLKRCNCDLALSVTGIAGPGGGTVAKPVGTVCFAIAIKGKKTATWTCFFTGNREQVRRRAKQWILHQSINSV